MGGRAFWDTCQLQVKPDFILYLWCFSVILFQKLLSVLAGGHILVLFRHLREMRKVTVPKFRCNHTDRNGEGRFKEREFSLSAGRR